MSENERHDTSDEQREQPEIPEFKDAYFFAFAALMLYKVGGSEAISLERLEQFPDQDSPTVEWDAENEAFVMKNKDLKQPVIVVPGSVAKKMARARVRWLKKTPVIIRN